MPVRRAKRNAAAASLSAADAAESHRAMRRRDLGSAS